MLTSKISCESIQKLHGFSLFLLNCVYYKIRYWLTIHIFFILNQPISTLIIPLNKLDLPSAIFPVDPPSMCVLCIKQNFRNFHSTQTLQTRNLWAWEGRR